MVKLCDRLKIHYAWLILFSCCCFFGSAMGIYSNCSALYTADILKDMNWTYTLSTVIGIALTVSRFIGTRMTTAVFKKLPLKPVLTAALVTMMGGCIAKGFMHSIAVYTLLNVIVGFSGAFLLYVPVPMLINSWFKEKRDTALGIAMLSSGLMAAVLSPLFSSLTESRGWRYACVVNGIIGLAVSVPAVLLFIVKSPEELGLKPYGWKEEEEAAKVATSPSQIFENGHPDFDTRYSVKEKRSLFVFSMILAMLVNGMCGIPSRLPHFASVSGLGSAIGGLMLSVTQVGNMASKALMGPLSDKFGPRKTYTVSASLVFLAYLALCFSPASHAVLLVIAFLSGISQGNNMMIYPAAVRTYSRGEEYTYYISRVSMGILIFGTPFSLLISLMFDKTGGYSCIFVMFAVLEAVCVLLILKMFPKEK